MWYNCDCPESPEICVDALNFLFQDPAAADCRQRQRALDCALMPVEGAPHGTLCDPKRFTFYKRNHPDCTCQELALSFSDSTCSLSFNPNALVRTTIDPDLSALKELLSKCTDCARSTFYCQQSLEYVTFLREKSLTYDSCSEIQHAFDCGFVPTTDDPKGFLGKQVVADRCQDLASKYSFPECSISCAPDTSTAVPDKGCKVACLTATCDLFVGSYGVACSELETYGCDCSGCDSCSAASVPPENYVMKVGFECGRVGLQQNRVNAGGTPDQPSFIDKNIRVQTCAQRCNAHSECGGFTYVLPRMECEYFADMSANVESKNTDTCYTKIDYTPPLATSDTPPAVTVITAPMDASSTFPYRPQSADEPKTSTAFTTQTDNQLADPPGPNTLAVVLPVSITVVVVIALAIVVAVVIIKRTREQQYSRDSLQNKNLLRKTDWTQSAASGGDYKYDLELHTKGAKTESYAPPSVEFDDDDQGVAFDEDEYNEI